MTDEVRQEGFAPCPTCRQYSHSIGDDALAKAFMHFETMYAHPVRGHAMGQVFDDQTRDAAQVLTAEARHASPLRDRIAVLEGALADICSPIAEPDTNHASLAAWWREKAISYRQLARATLNGEKKDG